MSESLHFLGNSAGHLVPVLRGVSDGLWQRVWISAMAAWYFLPWSVRGHGVCDSVGPSMAPRVCPFGNAS